MIGGSPKILIVRLSAIGDVVRVLPALHILRNAYPDAQIDWAVEPKSADAVDGHPAVDELLVFNRADELWRGTTEFVGFCNEVRRRRYDIVFDFHGILKSGMIAAASRAKQRFGFARPRAQEGSHFFTNRRVRLPNENLNRVDENIRLCQNLVKEISWPNHTFFVPITVQEEVDAFFDEAFDGGKLVVAMHAPVDRPEKQWPVDCFARLSDMLMADGRFEVMLTYGPGQESMMDEILAESHRNPVVAPYTPDLKHYAWLAQRAALYVGGDTGPMHIAWAMGTPVVAVFGGTDPAKHAPFRQPHVALYAHDYPEVEEDPEQVVDEEDRMDPKEALMRRITPEMVYDACIELLFSKSASKPTASD